MRHYIIKTRFSSKSSQFVYRVEARNEESALREFIRITDGKGYSLQYTEIDLDDAYWDRKRKKTYSKFFRERVSRDPLARSIREIWRSHCDDEQGETIRSYTILPYTGQSREEIEELVESYRIPVRGPYDCSGQLFTRFLSWSLVPCGIAVVNHIARDI